jgi:hypothetical protein
VEIIDNKLVEEVVFDRCTFTDLFQGIAVHSSKSFTVMGLRVTNSIFDAISTYAILVTDNIAGVTSSLNTYLNVGTGFTSNTVVPLGYPLPRYSIRGDSPVSDILVSNVAAGDTINFNITSVDPAETFTYSVETWIGGSNIGNLLAQLPAEFAPPINNHTPITPVIKFGGNGSFSFGDFFFRTPDDDYFVDTVEHAASDIISFDTTSALKYGDRYQTIGRSLVVQPNTINFIPLLSKFFGGKIDYRVERFARYRTGTVTFTVDPLNLIVCWRDSYTEVHPTNITVEMEYSNFLSQTIVKRPILIIKSTSNDGPAIITYDVKSFVDENIGRPAFSADYIPPPPLYAIRATPESVEEGLGFNVRITGRNIVSCANGRRFKVTATGTNVNGYDFDLPLSTYYWIKGLDPVSRQRVDYASPGNTIFFKYTTPDRSETVSYEVVTPTGNEVQELDASPSELIVDVDQLPYLFKVKVREDFVTEGLETVTFSLYTWCIGEAESTTVVAFDNVDIIDSSLTPTLPPPTPTPIPTLTPTPTPTPIVFPTPEPVADYRIVANLVLLYPGTTVRFDVTSTNSSENLIYEIGPYSPTIPDPPHVNPSAFPNCVVGSVTYVNITGSLEGSGVWGNNVFGYTDDSDWNKAAVHAGLAYPGQSIRVVLTCLGTKSGFPVTTANGITTTAYPNMWCAVKLTIE